MPVKETITLQNKAQGASGTTTNLFTSRATRVEVTQFGIASEDVVSDTVTYKMKLTNALKQLKDNINSFTVGENRYKVISKTEEGRRFLSLEGEKQ